MRAPKTTKKQKARPSLHPVDGRPERNEEQVCAECQGGNHIVFRGPIGRCYVCGKRRVVIWTSLSSIAKLADESPVCPDCDGKSYIFPTDSDGTKMTLRCQCQAGAAAADHGARESHAGPRSLERVDRAREVRTIAKMIASHIGYTNGWRVTDEQYRNLCEYAAGRIVARMERRTRSIEKFCDREGRAL